MSQTVFLTKGSIPRDLTVVIVPDEATDGTPLFRAEIPELPGCMSHGDTEEEARQNLEEAFDLYTETLVARGHERPARDITLTSGTGLEVAMQTLATGNAIDVMIEALVAA